MTKEAKAAAFDKYQPGSENKTADEIITAMTTDGYEVKESKEVAAAIVASHSTVAPPDMQQSKPATTPAKKSIADQQATHATMKWFDEFEAIIQKEQHMNLLTNHMETITVGWEIGKKLHPKFIEPSLVPELNHFMDSFSTENPGKVLLPQGKYKNGDVITYTEWMTMQGRDPKKDRNALLLKTFVNN